MEKTLHYPTKLFGRCPILSFYELDEDRQAEALSEWEEMAEDSSYVLFNDELLNLSDFMVSESPLWDGYQGLSAWSGYFIKQAYNKYNELEAVVAYRHFP